LPFSRYYVSPEAAASSAAVTRRLRSPLSITNRHARPRLQLVAWQLDRVEPLVAERAAVEHEPDAPLGLPGGAGRPVDHEQPADVELHPQLLAELPDAGGVRGLAVLSTAPPGISHVDV
jgi:hypothetical protein